MYVEQEVGKFDHLAIEDIGLAEFLVNLFLH